MYRAVALQRLPTFVGEDQIGPLQYQLAATPIRVGGRDAILTVPMTLRQREIEREIAELDRSVNLGAVVFILLGAALGYSMSGRIGDPVQRLTRASRRIAAGDLDQHVVARTADELQGLVEAFNGMAEELSRQREQLQRTNRLEAWAEMARQVAHDIKNPLTPIQLSAEHLRRVHQDRGTPLSPVLEQCVDTILLQVRMLRQISSEFASFASSPTARPAPVALPDLADEVLAGYRIGLPSNVRVESSIPDGLPEVYIDRALLGRAMINIIENALHAMPSGGVVTLRAARARRPVGPRVARRHGRGHGCGGTGAPVRALLLDQGGRHGPRAHDCPAQRGDDGGTHRRPEREGRRDHGVARPADCAGLQTVPAFTRRAAPG